MEKGVKRQYNWGVYFPKALFFPRQQKQAECIYSDLLSFVAFSHSTLCIQRPL